MKIKYSTSFLLSLVVLLFTFNSQGQSSSTFLQSKNGVSVPYSTDSTHLTVWNGVGYTPVFIKGINFGVAVPGTFPGELAATRAEYGRWLEKINDIGYNVVRIYTLHYPRFYQVLDSFNLANPDHPVYLFQGIWLEEELEGYANDLYFMTDTMNSQIGQYVDCMHGNCIIPPRRGKAYGKYDADISPWLLGYIVGREIHPVEVFATNKMHPGDTVFQGEALSLPSGSPTETWVTQLLNRVVVYERKNYNTERPVSFSSWPTLDPLHHPSEADNGTMEDTASLDLANMDVSKAPAGFFISYHAYPYYPDFISKDSAYQGYTDYLGSNSYLGYLTALKKHYIRFPLIIAETGTPSSWGNAHYSQSGMNHGGMSETQQGSNFIRIMYSLQDAGCGGGIQFNVIDEWFKRTWVTDLMDFNPYSRIKWHNITAAEQNFGLIKFEPDTSKIELWDNFGNQKPVTEISAGADFDFFHMNLKLKNPMNNTDTLWIALDTYADTLGESVLPTGDTIRNRAEFLLRLTNYSAELFVTRAYDLYGNWFGISAPDQLFHSTATNGAPWDIVRWKNNAENPKIQYIGNLKVRQAEMFPSSMDAVVISDSTIDIQMPWTLINFSDPSGMRVIHDFKNIPGTQDTVSDGIAATVVYKNTKEVTQNRFVWDKWNRVKNFREVDKACVPVIKQNLFLFNSPPIPRPDTYNAKMNDVLTVLPANGLLKNDIDFDGDPMTTFIDTYPAHGNIFLYTDGSFSYHPDIDFKGKDHFTYFSYDEMSISDTASVYLDVSLTGTPGVYANGFQFYPNPVEDILHVHLKSVLAKIPYWIYDLSGRLMAESTFQGPEDIIDVAALAPGIYVFRFRMKQAEFQYKLVKY